MLWARAISTERRRNAPSVNRHSQLTAGALISGILIVVVAVLLLASPSDHDSTEGSGPASAIRQADLRRACHSVRQASAIPVLCPRRLPGGRPARRFYDSQGRDLEPSDDSYLLEIAGRSEKARGASEHIVFGGRGEPLPTRGGGETWPQDLSPGDDYLRLVGSSALRPGEHELEPVKPRVLGYFTVRGKRAMALLVAPYPDGGIHGGHYAAVWNASGHGYVVSLHYPRGDTGQAPFSRQLRALRSITRSMAR